MWSSPRTNSPMPQRIHAVVGSLAVCSIAALAVVLLLATLATGMATAAPSVQLGMEDDSDSSSAHEVHEADTTFQLETDRRIPIPPVATIVVGKSAEVVNDLNSDGVASPGEVIEYEVFVHNKTRDAVSEIVVSDTVPLHTVYVTETTFFDDGSSVTAIPDEGVGTPFPLDEGGVSLGSLADGGRITVTFQVTIDNPYLGAPNPIVNTAFITADAKSLEATATTEVYSASIELTKTASITFVGVPGTVVTYTYSVTNTGLDPLTKVKLVDNVCSPVSFVSGDVNSNSTIDAGEVWSYRCTMPISLPTTNIATVSALDRLGRTITDTATVFVDMGFAWLVPVYEQTPKICPPPNGCPLEGRINGLAVSEKTGDIFVASRADDGGAPDQLLKVNAYTAQVTAKKPTGAGSRPWGVVVNDKTGQVYVSNQGTGEVVVLDAETLAELARINVDTSTTDNVLARPGKMAILPELDTVFVAVGGENRIAIIEGLRLKESIPAGGAGPWGIAADPVRNLVYVSHRDSRSFSVLKLNGSDWQAKQGPLFDDKRNLFGLEYAPNDDPSKPGTLYVLWANKDSNWFLGLWEPNPDTVDWGFIVDMVIPSHGDIADPNVGGSGVVHNSTTGNVYTANTADDTVVVLRGDGSEYLDVFDVSDDPFPTAVNPATSMVYIGLREASALIAIHDTVFPEDAP